MTLRHSIRKSCQIIGVDKVSTHRRVMLIVSEQNHVLGESRGGLVTNLGIAQIAID